MNLLALLQQVSSKYKLKVSNNKAFICCPFHSRNGQLEHTPSFLINLSSENGRKQGSGHCFACGKNATWKEIAKAIGIEGNINFDLEELGPTDLKEKVVDTELPIKWDKQKSWRGIDGKLLYKLKCKSLIKNKRDFIRIPVYQNGEKQGFIDGLVHRKSKKELGYINSPGKWVSRTLFGFDYAKSLETNWVVVVEGPRDCLNLLQYGVPAVAILGCSNLNKLKVELLLANWDRLVCGFDPDEAGDKATEQLNKLVANRVPVKKIYFEEGTDAADVDANEAKTIKHIWD